MRRRTVALLENGNITIFDNGYHAGPDTNCTGRCTSRALELDPATGKIVWEFRDARFFSQGFGDVDRLPNGNTLTPKKPGVYRILALGDSNTIGRISDKFGWAREPYPQRLERMVAERLGPGKVEVLNAGMGGYMSFQGVMLLRTKFRDLDPDLITVRYGWNDHLMSTVTVDRDVFREPDTAVGLLAEDLLLRPSLYRCARRMALALQAKRRPVAGQAEAMLTMPLEWRPAIPLPEVPPESPSDRGDRSRAGRRGMTADLPLESESQCGDGELGSPC